MSPHPGRKRRLAKRAFRYDGRSADVGNQAGISARRQRPLGVRIAIVSDEMAKNARWRRNKAKAARRREREAGR